MTKYWLLVAAMLFAVSSCGGPEETSPSEGAPASELVSWEEGVQGLEGGGEEAARPPPGFCGPNGPFCQTNVDCSFICGWPGGTCNATTRCCACIPAD